MSCFSIIENHSGTKIPIHLKKILSASGFDNKFSLLNLNNDSIQEIEEFINLNKNILNSTKYENCEPFRFNIADKHSILSFPKYLHSTNTKKLEKNENEFDPIIAKQELLHKIEQYITKQKITLSLVETDIISCSISNKVIRCVVKCPQCEIQIPCTKTQHWRFGNFTSHIKKQHQNPSQNQEVEIADFDKGGKLLSSVVKHINNAEELNHILR